MPRSTQYRRMVKCPEPPSPSSTDATFGSDIESPSESEEEINDIDDIAESLLQPDPEPPTKIEPPFNLCSVPGPLLLQLVHFVLLYFNLISSNTPHFTPPPRRPPPRRSAFPVRFGSRRNLGYYPSLRRIGYGAGPSIYEEDETEYVVPPTPGTDEEPTRITVTQNCSEEKIETHLKNMLRIYRVPDDERQHFRIIVLKYNLLGYPMRRPVDDDDTVGVFRHGNRSWDLGMNSEIWMLLGTDHHRISDIVKRCEYRKPPFMRRVSKTLWRSTLKLVSPLIPWA